MCEYESVLDNGTVERYTANVIAENLYSQCDSEGHQFLVLDEIYSQCDYEGRQFLVLDEIIDHAKDNTAITINDGYTKSYNGNRVPKQTTKKWKLLCQWHDGSSTWISLVDLKDSNPVELANRLQEEPAFKLWVSSVLRKRNHIIAKVKSHYWSTLHKFGTAKDSYRGIAHRRGDGYYILDGCDLQRTGKGKSCV
jgi:hypothetical protein